MSAGAASPKLSSRPGLLEHPLVPLLGRLLIVYIFATSALGKIFDWSGNVAYMQRFNLPWIPLLLGAAVVIEVVGSICLVTGYHARWAAVVMFLYTIALTLLLHNYWSLPAGELRGMRETHFRKNLAIAGGLLMLAYAGPGRWSLGRRRRSPSA